MACRSKFFYWNCEHICHPSCMSYINCPCNSPCFYRLRHAGRVEIMLLLGSELFLRQSLPSHCLIASVPVGDKLVFNFAECRLDLQQMEIKSREICRV
jgi:hypothetical protein